LVLHNGSLWTSTLISRRLCMNAEPP
jgi:hypothetical protein